MSILGYRAFLSLALLLGGVAVQPGFAGGLHPLVLKNTIIEGRMVAKVPIEGLTSYGLNYESYIFEVENGAQKTKKLIKFSYRFDQREPQLPKSFFDYSLTHKFSMRRDEECDESWGSVSNRLVFDSTGNFQGKQDALVYAKNAAVPQLDQESTLACYVGTPRDYRATVKRAVKQQKQAIQPPASVTPPATSGTSNSPKAVALAVTSTHKEEK